MNDEGHARSRDGKDNIRAEGTAQQASLSSGAGCLCGLEQESACVTVPPVEGMVVREILTSELASRARDRCKKRILIATGVRAVALGIPGCLWDETHEINQGEGGG